MDYAGKRVLVVGMARSGVAAAQLLLKHGALVTVNDAKTKEELGDSLKPLEGLANLSWAMGCPAASVLAGQEVLVISPGIPDTAPFVCKAREMGLYVTGELELAAQLSPGTLVSITGTNGKTTTVSLVGDIFARWGKTTHVVGNIGFPYSLAGTYSKLEDMVVCEVSSFQMEMAETFHPKVGALLNITEDHLNRHGTMEAYTQMKMRMFVNQTAEDYAVFNDDDAALAPLMGQVKSRVVKFSRLHPVETGAYVAEGIICVRLQGVEEKVCPAAEVYIPGPHNLENALAATCIARCAGVPVEVIAESLRKFQGVEHRIEFVRELDGVRYINDSKGTNADSTIKAVQTMDRPTAIILGGYDKHSDFTALCEEIRDSGYIRAAVVIGDTAQQFVDTLDKVGYQAVTRATTLQDAVEKCRSLAQAGWNVLLSPACASFDMFSDYEARGRIFKEIVRNLK